eukprot:COSAG01_NODE_55783_length_322_cov_7.865471_1_plen_66_part_10
MRDVRISLGFLFPFLLLLLGLRLRLACLIGGVSPRAPAECADTYGSDRLPQRRHVRSFPKEPRLRV